ncbi:vacuolar carboxypeptidase-like protein Cps1 [Lophiostoma macrostomum CBS 122681]|uniref:Vacuolar carboxypeptidase-like protein Cps1 n=1 Tax=Lophiostoma macrostomum CBS 122681 TaxID=1314788 RepID=A0A6A6T8C1_9PLEO|nr:vacuolar carboxypeptidase-like protein Cps1 [Lophiostoma macrostomum CBS 122681]
MEKNWGAETAGAPLEPRNKKTAFRTLVLPIVGIWTIWILFRTYSTWAFPDPAVVPSSSQKCPQVEPLFPALRSQEMDSMDMYLESDTFLNKSVSRLSGAVRIPTESFDDMGPYLAVTFPLVHASLQIEKVNTHGLLYTWAGSDTSLKPTLLMAHQDVVPVPDATVGQWTHPPFSGFFDGKFVWGRGASDCKNQLIAILEAVEALLESDFSPRRTLLLSFGFDEEISGREGANTLAPFLVKRYGKGGVAAIVDEGAPNAEVWGRNFAVPGVAEKGYVDVDIVVRMPGGHSSVPPKHNGIGVASELITRIEENTYEPRLDDQNPYLELMRCGAEHAPAFPSKLKKLLKSRDKKSSRAQEHTCNKKDRLALEASKENLLVKYLMTTSVAVDIIHGGVKTNALPERTQFTVNHRINVGSSSQDVFGHIAGIAKGVAEKYGLALTPFNGTETPFSITLSYHDTKLEPAPVTPTGLGDEDHDTAYGILSGTTRALYGQDLLVAPGIMTGNTDTRYYWDLSENIFRYGPGWDREQTGFGNIHTVDEKVGAKAHVDTVRWMAGFVRNMDEANL